MPTLVRPAIDTERLTMRPPRLEDFEEALAMWGDPGASWAVTVSSPARVRARDPEGPTMPPLGTGVVDAQGVAVLRAWIEQL